MRKRAQRIHTAMDAAAQAATLAEETQRRAQIAAVGTSAKYNPVTVANRIQALTADQSRITRQLDGHTRTIAVMPDGTPYVEANAAATGTYRDQLSDLLAVITEQLTYWQSVRDEQITSGTATGYGPEGINKGDAVQIRGRWYEVVRANKKTITVPSTLGPWTDTTPHHQIQNHRPRIPADQAKPAADDDPKTQRN